MGVFGSLFSAARHAAWGGETLKFGGKQITFGGGIRRTIAGAAIGGGIGVATGDEQSSTGKFQNFLAGAAVGAGVGGLTTAGARGLMGDVGRGAWKRLGLKRVGGTVGRTGLSIGEFALSHPKLTIGAAMGVGAYSMFSDPSQSHRGTIQAYNMAVEEDLVPNLLQPSDTRMVARSSFQDSTVGLTQGLHRGRHR